MSLGLAAATWAGIGTVGSLGLGAYSASKGSKQTGTQTATEQKQLDPRIESMLFGGGGNGGLLSRYQGMLDAPQSDAMQGYGKAAGDYLGNYGADTNAMRAAATGLLGPMSAPQAAATAPASVAPASTSSADFTGMNTPMFLQAASGGKASTVADPMLISGSKINAPNQNGLDLKNAYNGMVYGDPANNPYLTGAIQKGINQSNTAFGNMVTDAKAATQDVLGSIRSNSVLAGQYGGSRQGIAEGKAIDSMNTNLARAASQFGQNNTDAAVSAQAGAFDAGQNRSLSAMQGLGAQQYGVAGQNAANDQQANLSNQGATNSAAQFNANAKNDMSKFNAGMTQQAGLANQATGLNAGQFNANAANAGAQFNANSANNNAQFNASAANNNAQFNAGLGQQINLANLQAQLGTNNLNSSNVATGSGLLGGLMANAYNGAAAQDAYGLDKAGKVNGLLAPYLNANSSSTESKPLYENTAGNMLGGALMGGQLAGKLGGSGLLTGIGNLFGGSGSGQGHTGSGPNGGTFYDGYEWQQ